MMLQKVNGNRLSCGSLEKGVAHYLPEKEILGITQKMLMEQLKELLNTVWLKSIRMPVIRRMLNIIFYQARRAYAGGDCNHAGNRSGRMLEDNREEFLKEKGLI